MYDFGSILDWMASLDPRTRTALAALTREIASRHEWSFGPDAFSEPAVIVGRLEGLTEILLEEKHAVTALANDPLAREDLVVVLTYLDPLWRVRLTWDLARMLPDTPKGARPTSLLDATINDRAESPDDIKLMRRYLRVVVGLLARTRLAMDMLTEERLDRVEAAMKVAGTLDMHGAGMAPSGRGDGVGEQGGSSA